MSVVAQSWLRVAARHSAWQRRAALSTEQAVKIDWENLGFDYMPTKSWVQYDWKDGKWDAGTVKTEPYLNIHIMSNALHYGQALFEGLKAHHGADGAVRLFASEHNYARMKSGCDRFSMPEVPPDMFQDALTRVVSDNIDYVPPYGSGGSMYIRPFFFGHGAKLGLGPAPMYSFCVMANPVGAYYKGGLTAIDACIVQDFDRAAPRGAGNVKAAGNYAPDVMPSERAKADGFSVCLYLDAATQTEVEEFSTSNFIAISADGAYVTPKSDSVLPSVTNKVLSTLAADMGLKVERRAITWDEIASGGLREVAACGTAVVITPIKSITRGSAKVELGEVDVLAKLYDQVTSIHRGELPDPHGWCRTVASK